MNLKDFLWQGGFLSTYYAMLYIACLFVRVFARDVSMELRKERVTPKKAAEWLQRNVNNRPLSVASVNKYAAAMLANEWKMNGESIKFNGNGDLIDGQHRLHAIVKSGVTVETVVVRGLEHDAFDTIDQGNRRKLCDVYARRGEKNYVILASAVRNLWRLANGYSRTHGELRPAVADSILEKHPQIRDSVGFIKRYNKGDQLLSYGLAAALHYLFSNIDSDKATQFWLRVFEGEGITKAMPEYILRKTLLDNKTASSRLHPDIVCAFSIKAWNGCITGKPIKILKWDAREDFPEIAGATTK